MRSERVLAIENPCRLSIDTARLKIEREGITSSVAIVDIGVLLIDTVQVELTAGVIRELAQADIAIIVTDAKHYPSALLMPSAAHTHTVKRQRLQATMQKTFCDNLWAITIAAKLRNQAKFLSAQGNSDALARFERMANTIQAGDPENFEAQGAKLYWRDVFKEKFKREKQGAEDVRNAALNFGYAILRGLFARYISVSGLSPVFGFGHSNFENPYCLVDDLIEPYRPCVDALVATMINYESNFDGANKRIVLKLLDCEALIESQGQIKKYRLHTAIYETITAYARALEGRRENLLEYPIGFVLPLG
jgi:CRISPR-associated protein Cas1